MSSETKKAFNILIVDDNTKNIQVIGNILKEASYRIGFATNGQQAIDLLQKSYDYDLVLLDVDMPQMNGFEACRILRKDERLKEIPVIFLTAFTDEDNVIAGFESGGQDYIAKPFNSKELLARIETHLQLKHKTDLIKKLNRDLELKVAERTKELEKAYQDLNNLDKMKTDYLFFISQEIRTPLDGIAGAINLIKNHEYSSTFQSLMETLSTSVRKLEEFTQKALFFNQLVNKQYPLNLISVNVKNIVQFSLLEEGQHIQEKSITVNADSLQANLFITADRDLLFKAFLYIISNAVRFSPTGGEITLALKENEGSVIFSCVDSGNGFSPEILNRLLLPFQFISDNIHQKSVMSLFIVKQIMEIHNGRLNVSNLENGCGCVELIFAKM
ncbi:MAG TPA: hybrid sensor histidine kinase/response regulator [Bacteroidales bacterium]